MNIMFQAPKTYNKMRKYLLLICCLLVSYCMYGQILGPSSAYLGDTKTYTFDNGIIYSSQVWGLVNGTRISSSRSGTTYSVSVQWTTIGTGRVSFLDQNYQVVSTKDVAVTQGACATPPAPNVTLSSSTNLCGSKTLSYSGTPPTNVLWYWQTSAGGFETLNSTTNQVAGVSGTYYLRAKATCGSSWSSTSVSITVTVNNPLRPGQITYTPNTCNSITLNQSGTPASGCSWFWQGTDINGTETTPLASAPTYSATINGSNTYYIRSRHNASNCWSSAEGVNVSVDNPAPPSPGSFNFCEFQTMNMTLGGALSTLKWYDASNQLIHSGTTYTPTQLDVGTYTYNVKNVSFNGCLSSSAAAVTLTVKANCDDYLNWSETKVFTINSDGTPKEVGSQRSYNDGFDNIMQTQSKSYSTGHVFASQVIYDSYGEQTLQTLSAPINSTSFGYRHRFVTNAAKVKYQSLDFDAQSGTSGTPDNPGEVGDNGIGSLGWYYSSANTLENNVPTTKYPYARSWAEVKADPKVAKSSGPGDQNRMGQGHEVKSERFDFLKSELAHYFTLRPLLVSETILAEDNLININPDANTITGFQQTVGATVSALTQNNQTYVKAVCTQTTGNPGIPQITNVSIAVTAGQTYKFRVRGYRSSSTSVNLYVKNVNTGAWIIVAGAQLPQGAANEKWIESTFVVPSGCTSITVGVLWPTGVVNDSFYINSVSLSKTTSDNVVFGEKIVSTDPDGKRTVSFIDNDGNALASAFILSTNTGTNPVSFNCDYWSYNYYNALGQLVASVAPNGVVIADSSYPKFVRTFKYDHFGRLIETTSPDEGTSQLVYSKEGYIRFSQNQEQRNASPKRFSYSNYDKVGHLIEVGEYTMSGSGYFIFEMSTVATPSTNSILSIVDNTGFTGITKKNDPSNRCTDVTFVEYAIPAADFVSDQYHTSQENLFEQISKTEKTIGTDVFKTWYSYNEFGQLSWTKQYIPDLGYKIIDYSYDFSGNITDVVYQKGTTEAFYHHYSYDNDERLLEVRTSLDGINKTLHAIYKYYLHGPLKRVELATNKQGIDYVYSIDGSLKAINDGDPTKDPGGDGKTGSSFTADAFGETLHYYDNDFIGTGTYVPNSFALDGATYPNSFSTNPKAISYNNSTDLVVGGSGKQTHLYAYQYDALNQLKDAKWGTINGSIATLVEDQRENISGYDKNGNISGLLRKGVKNAQVTANYSYIYEPNTNKLDKINNNGVLSIDYAYNSIGQMTQQSESSKVLNVTYNAYGLVKEVRNSSNQLMESYTYNDGGDLAKRTEYNGGSALKNTHYVYDGSGQVLAIYEKLLPSGALQLLEIPIYGAGRLGVYRPALNPNPFLYEVTDHLGNVRAVIGPSVVEKYTATMESEMVSFEEPPFKNIVNTNEPFVNANNTQASAIITNPNEVARLNNAKPAGPAIILEVSPGDKIDLDVWAYYEAGSSNFTSLLTEGTMVNAIAAAFGGVSGASGEAGKIFNNVQTGFAGSFGLANNELPAAFMTCIVYDKNFTKKFYLSRGVTESGNMAKEHLVAPTFVIEQPGYIYVCLYNYSDDVNPVYFDDLVVQVTNSPIVSGADYYPFGLVQDGREITDEPYRYGYQGQFSEKDTTTKWNDFKLRNYDARTGRWLSPDPYGQFHSPYLSMGNNPVLSVDPTGGWTPINPLALLDVAAVLQTVPLAASMLNTKISLASSSYSSSSGLTSTGISVDGNMIQVVTNEAAFAQSGAGRISPISISSIKAPTPFSASLPAARASLPSSISAMHVVQNIVGIAGFVPGLNVYAGVIETAAALYNGDYVGAGFAALGAVPVAGVLFKWAKLGIATYQTAKAGRALKSAYKISGVYDVTVTGAKYTGRYIGEGQDIVKRLRQHTGYYGKFRGHRLTVNEIYSMPGSSSRYREVMEQQILNGLGGVNAPGVLNKINPHRLSAKWILF
jgi:RHS repeat-associated protein